MVSFTVGGVRLKISLLFPAAVVWLCVWNKSGTAAGCVYASLWHETGHLLSLYLLGLKPRELTFGAFGMRLVVPAVMTPAQRVITALAGPVFNGIAAAVFAWFHCPQPAMIHLLLGSFNLLPVQPLDGGQALYDGLAVPFGERVAARVLAVTSAATVLPLSAAAVWVLWYTGYNFTLGLLCLYLFLLLVLKKKG